METVRKKGTGTYDRTTKTWRLRGKGIQVSIRQLAKLYKTEIPPTEKDSRPYWRRYLQDVEDRIVREKKATSPFPDRLASIERLLAEFASQNRDEGQIRRLQAMREEVLDANPYDTPLTDTPVLHPDMQETADMLSLAGVDQDMLTIGILNNLAASKPAKVRDSIKTEADLFVERKKAKGHNGWYAVKQAIDMFVSVTGDIPLHDVNVHHYRTFNDKVMEYPTWGDRTKANQQQTVKSFLSRVEADHNVSYGFLRNRDYNLQTPEGNKVQYTIDQVRTALEKATGNVRLALLLGLNCGFYWGDICTLTKDMYVTPDRDVTTNKVVYVTMTSDMHDKPAYLQRHREKNKHKKPLLVACWRLWGETEKALHFGPLPSQRRMSEHYLAFQLQHNLPSHKALRKTTAQLIQDHVGETESRLFRCETRGDTHHSSYIVHYTPEQVAKLEKALLQVAKLYGIE